MKIVLLVSPISNKCPHILAKCSVIEEIREMRKSKSKAFYICKKVEFTLWFSHPYFIVYLFNIRKNHQLI